MLFHYFILFSFILIKVARLKMISISWKSQHVSNIIKENNWNIRKATWTLWTPESCKIAPTHLCIQWTRTTKLFDRSKTLGGRGFNLHQLCRWKESCDKHLRKELRNFFIFLSLQMLIRFDNPLPQKEKGNIQWIIATLSLKFEKYQVEGQRTQVLAFLVSFASTLVIRIYIFFFKF